MSRRSFFSPSTAQRRQAHRPGLVLACVAASGPVSAMVHVEITPSESPQGSSFRVVARKPRDDYRFGIIMTSTKEGTVTVRGVAKDSVLAIEGLQTGDVLLEIGNQKIDSAKAVSWSLSQAKANDAIELFVFRPPLSERLGPAAEVSLPKAPGSSKAWIGHGPAMAVLWYKSIAFEQLLG